MSCRSCVSGNSGGISRRNDAARFLRTEKCEQAPHLWIFPTVLVGLACRFSAAVAPKSDLALLSDPPPTLESVAQSNCG